MRVLITRNTPIRIATLIYYYFMHFQSSPSYCSFMFAFPYQLLTSIGGFRVVI